MPIDKNNIGLFVIQLIGVLIITIPIFSLVGAAQTSTLEVISDPGGANVYVDDVYKGQTNIDLSPFYIYNIPYGSHIIRIGKSSCNEWSQTYQISAPTTSVLASLTCPSLLGTFIINSIPDSGGIYIDNNFKGFTPITISDAPYGSHAVKIVKSGYYDWVQNWLAGASPQTITAYLVPLPTPTPTPTPTGTLAVSSDPGGGSVYVDGVYKGLTPLDISQSLSISNVLYGSHVIKITRNGCDDWIQTYQVSAPTTTVLAPLTCPVPTGTFIINSDPSGASVYLDNNYKGTTSLTLTNIPQGSHTIKITKTGYQDWTQTHQTSTGTLTIIANLIPVPTPTPTTPTPTPTPTPAAVTPTPTTPTPTPTATPDMGYIYVWSSPAGGSIYVDGNYKGLTDSTQYVIIPTTTGYHAVEISKAEYDKYSTSVYVYFGQGTTVNAYLISIPTPTATPTPTPTPILTPTPTPTVTPTPTPATPTPTPVTSAIVSLSSISSQYTTGSILSATVYVTNTGESSHYFPVGFSVKDPFGNWNDLSYKPVTLSPGLSTYVYFTYSIPTTGPVGTWTVRTAVYDYDAGEGNLQIRYDYKEQTFSVVPSTYLINVQSLINRVDVLEAKTLERIDDITNTGIKYRYLSLFRYAKLGVEFLLGEIFKMIRVEEGKSFIYRLNTNFAAKISAHEISPSPEGKEKIAKIAREEVNDIFRPEEAKKQVREHFEDIRNNIKNKEVLSDVQTKQINDLLEEYDRRMLKLTNTYKFSYALHEEDVSPDIAYPMVLLTTLKKVPAAVVAEVFARWSVDEGSMLAGETYIWESRNGETKGIVSGLLIIKDHIKSTLEV